MQTVRHADVLTTIERLSGQIDGVVERDADLRRLSRWRIGGRAAGFVEPHNSADVGRALAILSDAGVPKLIIGDGSNLLFDDQGFNGVVVRVGPRLNRLRFDGHRVTAEAGLWVPGLVRKLGQRGLSGLEHAIGIPGSLGGLIYMNGGSQRKGIGSTIRQVRGCDLEGRLFERDQAQCQFGYRSSSLQTSNLVVLEADLEMQPADPFAMRREMIGIMADRRRKFPKNLPNCGSVFLSNPSMYNIVGPPGAAIERVGLKGARIGDAELSPLHANFIVNRGKASSRDVLSLIRLARARVHDATGFLMDCEVRHVAPDGTVRPAHEPADALPLPPFQQVN